jgi:hypothetical protein
MAKTGTLVRVMPDGTEDFTISKTADLKTVYELIGCDCVARIKVRYRGKARDCYLDDNGFITQAQDNPAIKSMAEAYYGQPCQTFMGAGVIWVPNEEITSG